jgi:hypothetical protein
MEENDKNIRAGIVVQARLIENKEKRFGQPFKDLGICSKCQSLQAFETKFGSKFAKCETFGKTLKSSDPVVKCTVYWEKSFLTLRDFMNMAILIDLKRKMGFKPALYEGDEE